MIVLSAKLRPMLGEVWPATVRISFRLEISPCGCGSNLKWESVNAFSCHQTAELEEQIKAFSHRNTSEQVPPRSEIDWHADKRPTLMGLRMESGSGKPPKSFMFTLNGLIWIWLLAACKYLSDRQQVDRWMNVVTNCMDAVTMAWRGGDIFLVFYCFTNNATFSAAVRGFVVLSVPVDPIRSAISVLSPAIAGPDNWMLVMTHCAEGQGGWGRPNIVARSHQPQPG